MTLDNLRRRPTPVSSLGKVQMGAITGAQLALMIALLAVLAAGGVVLSGVWPPADEPAPAVRPAPISEPAPEPVEPELEPTSTVTPPPMPEPEAEPLPTLAESDEPVRDALADIPLGVPGQQFLTPSNVIERSTSLIYLMAQGDVPYKLLPIARPKAAFAIYDDGTQVVADAAGFSRYDALAQWLNSLDLELLSDALAWFTPLFREAWSYYGGEASGFDMAVLTTLDLMIATPDIELSEARLIRKEAVWVYEEPAIEALPPLQKQILRMGPDNAATLKGVAGRARLIWVEQLNSQ